MRMKKVTAMILIAAMCFSLASCKSSDTLSKSVEEMSAEEIEEIIKKDIAERETAEENTAKDAENSSDMQVIGSGEFGYVSVPDNWVEFRELDGGTDFQYSNSSGTSIITLNVFSDEGLTEEQKDQLDADAVASSVWYNLENNEVTDLVGAKVTLNGYDATQVYGYFVNEDHGLPSVIVCWIVEDEQGAFHYISAEGTLDDIVDVVSYVESSYSFENPDSTL